jgi:hypothetical protein
MLTVLAQGTPVLGVQATARSQQGSGVPWESGLQRRVWRTWGAVLQGGHIRKICRRFLQPVM